MRTWRSWRENPRLPLAEVHLRASPGAGDDPRPAAARGVGPGAGRVAGPVPGRGQGAGAARRGREGDMAARVSGGGPEEMRRLAARLKTADQVLRRQLRKALTEAADPVTGAVREAIQGSPSKHDGTLRGEAARTVSSSVSLA